MVSDNSNNLRLIYGMARVGTVLSAHVYAMHLDIYTVT